MSSILAFGFLIGMQHALEADHVAAVSTLLCRLRSARRMLGHGVLWGVGHTLTLMVVAGGAVLAGATLSGRFAAWLEAGVGVMLVLLGGQVIWRLLRERVHFHLHRHDGETVHLHAHSHAGAPAGAHAFAHVHRHPPGLPLRSLVVGMMHGLAGSAALVVLTASTVGDPLAGVGYVLLFGIGSILGMAGLSAVLAVPLAWTARTLTAFHRILQAGVGAVACGLGASILLTSALQLQAVP